MDDDITGDGRADILVTSPWGLGILGLSGGSFGQRMIAANGTRFGGWLLNTADNVFPMLADLDGDGREEIVVTSPWGVGVLDHTATGLTSSAMAQNGTRLGGWVISTADNQLQHAGDVDGDGRDEILITSPWGLGILELGAGGLTSLLLHPNGTRFGGWLLNTADNWFPVMADLDGDGCDEIVVTSPWGLGVLKVNGGTLTSLVMAPNGVSFGDWTLDTATDHIEVAADVDGDGRAELVVSGPTKVAVLALQGGVAGHRRVRHRRHGRGRLDHRRHAPVRGRRRPGRRRPRRAAGHLRRGPGRARGRRRGAARDHRRDQRHAARSVAAQHARQPAQPGGGPRRRRTRGGARHLAVGNRRPAPRRRAPHERGDGAERDSVHRLAAQHRRRRPRGRLRALVRRARHPPAVGWSRCGHR